MKSFGAIITVLLATFAISLLIEHVQGRSRREFRKPHWYFVFFPLFVLNATLVYLYVPVESPYIYSAYGVAGAVASLVAQCAFGIKVTSDPD